jgi:hypothetical protein
MIWTSAGLWNASSTNTFKFVACSTAPVVRQPVSLLLVALQRLDEQSTCGRVYLDPVAEHGGLARRPLTGTHDVYWPFTDVGLFPHGEREDRIMLKLETRAELDALRAGRMKVSLTLEYKASGAVDKDQKKKEEMAKDALAFANAAGGQIIYGMQEKDNLPQGLDAGIDPVQFPGIWFEQVIQQNVSPQIEDLRIHEVTLDDGTSHVAVVVSIPAAQSRAPHQAKDGRYYRRHNFRNQIMEDYEVVT